MLRQDNTQATVDLLSNISMQFTSFTFTPPFINTTVRPSEAGILSSDPSPELGKARWLNVLWFLSLIFSLISAILGILVKQWIRTYLNWSRPTAAARYNILTRQIRLEQWQKWHITSFTSLIPALLEFAILLFLCGVPIFLGTFDHSVEVIISFFVGGSLLLILALIFLPALFGRCPYKSPTGLAFVYIGLSVLRLIDALSSVRAPSPSDPAKSTAARVVDDDNSASDVPSCEPRPFSNLSSSGVDFRDHFMKLHAIKYDQAALWRFRDLTGADLARGRLRGPKGAITDAHSALLYELEVERNGSLPEEKRMSLAYATREIVQDLDPDIARHYATALGESDLLFKALVWLVADFADFNTHNSGILRHLAHCIETIVPSLHCAEFSSSLSDSDAAAVRLTELVVDGGFRNLSIWHMLARLKTTGVGHMGSFVDHPHRSSIATYVLKCLRLKIDEPDNDKWSSLPYTFLPPLTSKRLREVDEIALRPLADSQFIVMSYVLACSLRARVSEALHYTDLRTDDPVVDLLYRRIREIFYALRYVALHWDTGTPLMGLCEHNCAEILADSFNLVARHPQKHHFDDLFPTLRYEMFWVLSVRYPVHFGRRWTLHVSFLPPGASPAICLSGCH